MSTSSPERVVDVEALGIREPSEARDSVKKASARKVEQRLSSLQSRIHDPAALRKLASQSRRHVLDHLDYYLVEAERRLTANGIQVHWAATADEACRIITALCDKAAPRVIVKSKTMVSEEIRLNDYLEARGHHPIETDLGEFVVQIDHDHPTHIVTPIIHKNRFQVAKSFEREGLGEYTEDPETLTRQAREHLRKKFHAAEVGITGANFVVAETGRFVLCTNEGNGRMCASGPRVHIALTGIEKIVAREADLTVLLKLLARSSTGQDLTVYTQFIAGPRRDDDVDGPEEVHLVLLDNGRSRMLGSRYHEMLQCIRCGACLNVCPVYRQVTGHAYESTYPGPMGKIFSPLLGAEGDSLRRYAHLPKASSLCAACEEVCPVAIPIPEFLLGLRDELHRRGGPKPKGTPPFGPWGVLASSPALWRTALRAGRLFGWTGVKFAPLDSVSRWLRERDLPPWPRQSFRDWWKQREAGKGGK